ncbi:MAG: transketolase [Longimicrobiales bacterium]|jgi:transketolase|nr:transketolase [Longimicrobiales bacterium]HCK34610.1 transketolase [Gemmatimonadota bacterium]|tara:strand:+ start:11330 stop:13336 length:2007 start_codon:yes stop_codon:yes gene_type:complete
MTDIKQQAVDAIRILSMDAVQQANSGHPGTPMALAPVGYVLFHKHLRHNPSDPLWLDRDRFVLSVGHASMLIYSLLHLSGYDLSEEDIRNFRQWGSPTAGHPEYGHAPGIETTTGPLGQGVANSVGLALAERWLAKRYNRPGHEVVDHFTYALCSDGDMMEGVSHEAAAIAGHQKLGKLIWIFDDNRITIDGGTELSSSTNQAKRFEAYDWHVTHVSDGNDLEEIDRAIIEAKRESERPSLIVVRTTIGYGSPGKAGTSAAHGAPLGQDEIIKTKENLGYPSLEPFHVENSTREHWAACLENGRKLQEDWQKRFSLYQEQAPDFAAEFLQVMSGELPEDWDENVPNLTAAENEDATRGWSGKVLQGVASGLPNLIGGSADLAGSNKTTINGADNLLSSSPGGRNIHYGIREHAMASIMNGMALHGGIRPFGGTFLIFSDYMRPAIRLAALMGQSVIYVFTHDSIGLGEDGPTHQPVEQLAALRAVPNLCDLRPGDAAETEIAWRVAIERTEGPSFLALTRQKVVLLDRGGMLAGAEGLRRGGYVLAEAASGTPEVILIASGSELGIILEARERLEAEGTPTRVVSLPSWYLFGRQEKDYRDSVLPPEISKKVSVEAASTFGWTRWVGASGSSLGLDHFGASAPSDILFEKFGFTVEDVVEAARNMATL